MSCALHVFDDFPTSHLIFKFELIRDRNSDRDTLFAALAGLNREASRASMADVAHPNPTVSSLTSMSLAFPSTSMVATRTTFPPSGCGGRRSGISGSTSCAIEGVSSPLGFDINTFGEIPARVPGRCPEGRQIHQGWNRQISVEKYLRECPYQTLV